MGYNENDEMEEYDQEDIITLTDENGEQFQCLYLDTIEYEGAEYAALLTLETEDSGEILIFRIEESEYEDMDDYVSVEDEEVLAAVYAIVKERFEGELNFSD